MTHFPSPTQNSFDRWSEKERTAHLPGPTSVGSRGPNLSQIQAQLSRIVLPTIDGEPNCVLASLGSHFQEVSPLKQDNSVEIAVRNLSFLPIPYNETPLPTSLLTRLSQAVPQAGTKEELFKKWATNKETLLVFGKKEELRSCLENSSLVHDYWREKRVPQVLAHEFAETQISDNSDLFVVSLGTAVKKTHVTPDAATQMNLSEALRQCAQSKEQKRIVEQLNFPSADSLQTCLENSYLITEELREEKAPEIVAKAFANVREIYSKSGVPLKVSFALQDAGVGTTLTPYAMHHAIFDISRAVRGCASSVSIVPDD